MLRAVLVAAIACVGCTYDFESYLPSGESSSDATTADAAVDTAPACVLDGGDGCYGTARTCGDTCRATRATCEAACTNPGCRKNCRDADTACRSACTSDCTTCTTNLGCATAARCQTEVG